ncbi:MAG: septal ring lytic transglycosylase RlpA family protein [Gammaproteobacteria bacterium]
MEQRSKYGNPVSYEVFDKRYYVMNSSKDYVERGIASWYGRKFHGRRTSSGETYDMYAMTAAHKELPLPTYVEVTNLENGRRVIVKVNDRGPFHDNRIIDLSYTAAAKLDIIGTGTGLVEVRAIDPRSRPEEGSTIRVAEDKRISPQNGFYIQVGAFSDLINAVNLRNRLSSISTGDIHISEVVVEGSLVHRVRIGPIDDVEVADNIVAELGRYGVLDHHIVLE